MFWEHLEIVLTPRQAVVKRRWPGRWRNHDAPVICEPITSPANGADWQEAVSALGKLMARARQYGSRAHLALSDLWVRMDLTSVGSARLSDDEMLLLARTHLAQQFPDAGHDGWSIRLARQDTRMLAAGVSARLLQSLREAAAASGLRLTRIEPLFAWVHDRYRKDLLAVTGWMVLVEPGMITIASTERGQLISLHAQRCDTDQEQVVLRLLERQSALLARPSLDVCVFSVATRGVRLPAPWHTLWQQNVIDIDKGAPDASVGDVTAA